MDFIAPFVVCRKRNAVRIIAIALSVVCLIGALSHTAQAENTYVITDGNAVTVHTTYTSDPAAVLREAGVTLSPDDLYSTAPGDGVSEITIRRVQNITVYYGDDVLQVTSYGETLEALLVRLGITVDDSIKASKSLDTLTYDGMEVRVDQLHRTIESYTVELANKTVYLDEPTLPVGVEKILEEGRVGQMLCSANVLYVNTQEQSRTIYENTVIEEPVDRVIAVGTGEKVEHTEGKLTIGDGYIILPTGEVLTYTRTDQFVATAYTHTDEGCDEYTANGTRVKWGVVAVDPRVIPYGTRMFIVSNDGEYVYGLSTAEDCGGAIKNKRLDLYMPTTWECFQFGIRDCTVYFLGGANWKDN